MEFACASDVSCVSLFRSVKGAEVFTAAVLTDRRSEPAAAIPHDPFRVSTPTGSIAHILAVISFAQIVENVVQLPPVAMVNLILGPLAGHVEPRQPVGEIMATIQRKGRIAVARFATRDTTGVSTIESKIAARA